MGRIERQLSELGIALPDVPVPHANYLPVKHQSGLHRRSAIAWFPRETRRRSGRGDRAGRNACLRPQLRCGGSFHGGDLDRVKQVIAVHGLVNSAPDFTGQALVMNGASNLLVQVFGEAGKHVRTAVGVAGLPMAFAASVHMIVEVE